MHPGEGLSADAAERVPLLAESDDPDLRALALATLHVASADPAEVVSAGRRESPAVRRRWVMILGFLSDEALARGDAVTASELMDRARALAPQDPGVLRAAGLLHNRTGDFEAAIAAFSLSLDADPVQPLAHVNLGIARAAAGDEAGAVREYEAAIALNPNEPLAWFNLGNLQLRGGNLAAAIASLGRALAVAPELSRAHVSMAVALAQAGRVADALTHARRAVEFAPGDETARRVLADLEAAAGRRPSE